MIKLLSLFSGIGAFEKALENIGEPFEVVRYCEIDKYASKAYSLIHNLDENLNLKDVTTVQTDELPDDIDLVTYGFPCQDISIAGKKKGFQEADGNLTRSGLFFEALRIIEDTQPKIAIAENVKALTGKRFKTEFKIVLDSLNDAGYKNYWAVLNAKDYGIPQNRERVFIISVRNDIDHGFQFPKKYELKLRLKDLLEENADEKYYLDDTQLKNLVIDNLDALMYDKSMIGFEGKAREYNEISPSLTAREYKEPRLINESARVNQIGNLFPTKTRKNPNQGRLYDKDGISPTLSAMEGGNRQPFIVDEPNKNVKPVLVGGIGEKKSNGGSQYYQQDRVYDSDAIAMAHPAQIPEGSYKYGIWEQLSLFDNSPTIQKVDIPQIVKVRKYEVDKEKLVEVLRKQKKLCGWSNKELAEELEVPLTQVEHWFRTDQYFAIPDPDIWGELKWLLEMDDINEFDEAIMTFEEREGVYDKANRHYHENGISPTITVTMADEKIISGLRIRKLTPKECFRLQGFDDKDCDILVENGISNSQIYKMAGNSICVDVLEEVFVELLNQYEDVFPME